MTRFITANKKDLQKEILRLDAKIEKLEAELKAEKNKKETAEMFERRHQMRRIEAEGKAEQLELANVGLKMENRRLRLKCDSMASFCINKGFYEDVKEICTEIITETNTKEVQ